MKHESSNRQAGHDEPVNIFEHMLENIEQRAAESENLCKLEDHAILLFDGSDWHRIEASNCDTHQKALHWAQHLLRKPWVTTSHIRLFLSNVFCLYPNLAPTGPLGDLTI